VRARRADNAQRAAPGVTGGLGPSVRISLRNSIGMRKISPAVVTYEGIDLCRRSHTGLRAAASYERGDNTRLRRVSSQRTRAVRFLRPNDDSTSNNCTGKQHRFHCLRRVSTPLSCFVSSRDSVAFECLAVGRDIDAQQARPSEMNTETVFEALLPFAKQVAVRRGQVVICKGDPADCLYLLFEGVLWVADAEVELGPGGSSRRGCSPIAPADEGRSGKDAEKRIRNYKSPACRSSVISARSSVA
jgi:hypothetical protein